MTCLRFHDEAVLEDYLLGRMLDPEREAFERHYFDCVECFEELRAYRQVREALRRKSSPAKWLWAAAVAAALALAAGGLSYRAAPHSRMVQQITVPAPGPANPYGDLAQFEPPPYHRVVVRGHDASSLHAFSSAMSLYTGRRYAEAALALIPVVRKAPRDPGPIFYLGISLLLTSQVEEGIERLEAVTELGDTPYLESAQFHLAKAWLARGEPAAAARYLRRTISLHDTLEPEARRLLGRIESFAR